MFLKLHISYFFSLSSSDTGATPPESCIFGLMTFISACAGRFLHLWWHICCWLGNFGLFPRGGRKGLQICHFPFLRKWKQSLTVEDEGGFLKYFGVKCTDSIWAFSSQGLPPFMRGTSTWRSWASRQQRWASGSMKPLLCLGSCPVWACSSLQPSRWGFTLGDTFRIGSLQCLIAIIFFFFLLVYRRKLQCQQSTM